MAEPESVNLAPRPTALGPKRRHIVLPVIAIGCLLIAGLYIWSRTDDPLMHLLLDVGIVGFFTVLLSVAARHTKTGHRMPADDADVDRERLQLLIEASLDGVWEWDIDRQTLYLSPRWKTQLGYLDHELANDYETWVDLLHPEDRYRVKEQLRAYLADPTHLWECEFRLLHRHGGHRWILSRGSPVHRETGEIVRLLGVHIDITERKRSEQSLREAAAVFEGTSEGIVVTDAAGKVILVNPAFSRITGYAPFEIIGLRPNLLKSGRHDADFYRALWASLHARGTWQGEIWNRRKSGEIYPEWLSISRLSDDDGDVRYVGLFSDISAMKHTERRLEYLAHHDVLTDLPNRLLLDARLECALARTCSQGALGLLFIDLDCFKPINDRLGHQAGDQVLRTIAQRLLHTVRREDTVARLGGDEFVILIEAPIDREELRDFAQRIQAAIEAPMPVADERLAISASIGISLHGDPAKTAADVLDTADRAMYRIKAIRKGSATRLARACSQLRPPVAVPADDPE